MRFEIFTLCDNVQTYGGKMVVVGAMNNILLPSVPSMVPSLAIAIRMAFEKNEPVPQDFTLTIVVPSGKSLCPEIRFNGKPGKINQNDFSTVDLNCVMNTVVLPEFGVYTMTLKGLEKEFVSKFIVKDVHKIVDKR